MYDIVLIVFHIYIMGRHPSSLDWSQLWILKVNIYVYNYIDCVHAACTHAWLHMHIPLSLGLCHTTDWYWTKPCTTLNASPLQKLLAKHLQFTTLKTFQPCTLHLLDVSVACLIACCTLHSVHEFWTHAPVNHRYWLQLPSNRNTEKSFSSYVIIKASHLMHMTGTHDNIHKKSTWWCHSPLKWGQCLSTTSFFTWLFPASWHGTWYVVCSPILSASPANTSFLPVREVTTKHVHVHHVPKHSQDYNYIVIMCVLASFQDLQCACVVR